MTVEQYLKIFNNLPDDEPLPERIFAFNLLWSPLNLYVDYGTLYDDFEGGFDGLGREFFIIQDGYIKFMYAEWNGRIWWPFCYSNGIALNDDISLHCGQYDTPEKLINEAIKTLENFSKQGWSMNATLTVKDFEMAADRFRTWLAEVDVLDDSPKTYRR